MSVMTDNSMFQVVPELVLKLIVTGTCPGFGEIVPDNVTGDSTGVELGETTKMMVVDGTCVKVVRVVEVVAVVEV